MQCQQNGERERERDGGGGVERPVKYEGLIRARWVLHKGMLGLFVSPDPPTNSDMD